MPRNSPPTLNAGFTLLELVVVIVIIAIALTLAVPSWDRATQKRLVTQAAEEASAFLVTGQGEAIAQGLPVSLVVSRTGDTEWCVGAALGEAGCDCTEVDTSAASFCAIDGAPRRLTSADLPRVHLLVGQDRLPGSGDGRIVIDTVRGILEPPGDGMTLRFASRGGTYRLDARLGPTGLLWVCSPDADTAVPGYEACPS
jgi:prepilin-type N-terminal cleavage/methylation domain-containing protein